MRSKQIPFFFWNTHVGCSKVSSGCDYCCPFVKGHPCGSSDALPWAEVVTNDDWNGAVRFMEDQLSFPFRVPARGLLCWTQQLGDLFHPSISDAERHRVFGVMNRAPQHRFVFTTRRVQDMVDWLAAPGRAAAIRSAAVEWDGTKGAAPVSEEWPLPNVIVGASVSTQAEANVDVPALLTANAAKKLVWVAPILEAIDLSAWPSIDWLVVRAEEGDDRRVPTPSWVVDLKDWAVAQGVPFHFRGWGEDIDAETEETLRNAAMGDVPRRFPPPGFVRFMIGGSLWNQYPA